LVKKIFACLLMVVFFIETLPDQLLHELTNHHDTVDTYSATTSVGIKHIHCGALQISLPAYSKTESLQISSGSVSCSSFDFNAEGLSLSHFSFAPSGRAPPSLA